MNQLRTFFCVYYFDGGAQDFELYAVHSERSAADASLAELPDHFTSKVVAEQTLSGIKSQLLQRAIHDALQLRGIIGAEGISALEAAAINNSAKGAGG